MKRVGDVTYKLDSIQWAKPGYVEVRISHLAPVAPGGNYVVPEKPRVGAYCSIPELALEGFERTWEDGIVRCVWVYKTGEKMPRSPNDRSPEDRHSEQWTMSATVQQIPLEAHPNLKEIMEANGGTFREGAVEFPRFWQGAKNKWYGTRDYLFPSIAMTVRLPPEDGGTVSFDQLTYLGTNDTTPGVSNPLNSGFPFSPDALAGRKPWLLTDIRIERRGKKMFRSFTWRWGGLAGWADPIYALQWSGGNPNSDRENNRTGSGS